VLFYLHQSCKQQLLRNRAADVRQGKEANDAGGHGVRSLIATMSKRNENELVGNNRNGGGDNNYARAPAAQGQRHN
jgi:hypothetical protein